MSGDLSTGEGIPEAVAGVDVVVHCAGSAKGDDVKASHLVAAAAETGVGHLVYISVVGADKVPIKSAIDRAMFGYYAAKYGGEQAIAGSGLPWTIQRATQFHDLTFATVSALAKLPVVPVPSGWRFQPISSGEVADRLVALSLAPPAGHTPDMGGPRIYDMDELVRTYLDATGKNRPLLRLPLPGAANRVFKKGVNLASDRVVGEETWEDFLASRLEDLARPDSSRKTSRQPT